MDSKITRKIYGSKYVNQIYMMFGQRLRSYVKSLNYEGQNLVNNVIPIIHENMNNLKILDFGCGTVGG